MMSAPPATPFSADHTREVGVSGNVQHQLFTPPDQPFTGVNGTVWIRRQSTAFKGTESGILISAGLPSMVSGGTYVRNQIKGLPEGTYVGTQVEAGWLWAGASLPVAVRLSDAIWFTTQPGVRFAMFGALHIPAGLSIELGEHYRLDTEGGVNTMGWIPNQTDNPMFHTRVLVYGSLGLSKHW